MGTNVTVIQCLVDYDRICFMYKYKSGTIVEP